MATGRIPGPLLYADPLSKFPHEYALPLRGSSRVPGPLLSDAPCKYTDACDDLKHAFDLATLRRASELFLGYHCFSFGVTYGIGEKLVESVIECFELAKTFVLADLHESVSLANTPLWLQFSRDGVLWPTKRLLSQLAHRHFEMQLREAHAERDAIIHALWHVIQHPHEAIAAAAQAYSDQWRRFIALHKQADLQSQFEAGRIFGALLLDVIGLIAGVAGLARTLITTLPRLINVIARFERTGSALLKSRAYKIAQRDVIKAETSAKARQIGHAAPAGHVNAATSATGLEPFPSTAATIEYGKTLPNNIKPSQAKTGTARSTASASKPQPEALTPSQLKRRKLADETQPATAEGTQPSKSAPTQLVKPVGRQTQLQEKWGHLSKSQRTALTEQKLEANMYRRLQEKEAATPGAHFLQKHGAQLDLQSQYDRVTKRRQLPNGKLVGPPARATRFLSHRDQWNVIERAERIYKANPDRIELAEEPIKYGDVIGSGFDRDALKYGVQSSGRVYFDDAGNVVTAFPAWGR